VLPAVRLLATQPGQVVAEPGQRVMRRHATRSDQHRISSTHELWGEVHIAVAACASLVPHEAVAHARRHQQEIAGRECDLLVLCHEERLPEQHPDELEVVDDAGPHPCPPRVVRDRRTDHRHHTTGPSGVHIRTNIVRLGAFSPLIRSATMSQPSNGGKKDVGDRRYDNRSARLATSARACSRRVLPSGLHDPAQPP
jgi:hypothetical protein